MTTRMTNSFVLLLGTTAFLVSGAIAGQKPADTFTSPLHNFSITVPDYPLGTKVNKSSDKVHGWVAFAGGAGDQARIGYQRLDPPPPLADLDSLSRVGLGGLDSLSHETLREKIAGLDSLSREGLLKTMFQQLSGVTSDATRQHPPVPDSILMRVAAPAFLQIVGAQQQLLARYNARLISREPLVLDSTLMVFTLAVSPEGSDNIDMATGKRMDVVFGHLVFIRGGFLYNLVVQPNGFAAGLAAKTSNPQDELAQIDRRLIHALYRAIVFQ